MKLYFKIVGLLLKKYVLRQKTGKVLKDFVSNMGIAYIKFAQILATQNYGNLFTEEDRKILSGICDNLNPLSYEKVYKILNYEYGNELMEKFDFIDPIPVGSASISQVHRARLKTGEIVAIKIKRLDITKKVDKDIKTIKKMIHRYGKIFKFKNFIAGDNALNMYLNWIYEETDFKNEMNNIKEYQKFANSVNGKVNGTVDIKIPKLYEELCTDNVIVMEFIEDKTINKMNLTEENKEKISIGINSYFKSSFYALFHDEEIIFHGDPHSGNIYLDENNNIGFLDMGLVFVIDKEEAKLLREFFLTAYAGNYDKLYNMLIKYGMMSDENKFRFREETKKFCNEIRGKDVTFYFMDMVNICLHYQICPPDFLFKMTKAFMCLNGINKFINNPIDAKELLEEQTVEYLVRRSLNDCNNLAMTGVKTIPNFLSNVLKYGVSKGIAKELKRTEQFGKDIKMAYDNYNELMGLIKENVKI